jgi:hypothetical protein
VAGSKGGPPYSARREARSGMRGLVGFPVGEGEGGGEGE